MIHRQHKLTIIAAALCLMMAFAFAHPAHGQTNQEKYDKAGQLFAEGRTLANAGTAESMQASLPKLEQARGLFQEINAQQEEAYSLGWLGRINDYLGYNQKALDYYAQALPLFQAVDDKGGEAGALNNIGAIYSKSGELQQALKFYNEALLLSRAVKDEDGQAYTLNNIGKVYSDLGEKQQALNFYNKSLLLRRALNDKRGQAATLSDIGGVYTDLGEIENALKSLNESLPLFRAVKDNRGTAQTLNSIGAIGYALGDYQQALKLFKESLPLRREVGDKLGEAVTLQNIGAAYFDLGEKGQALRYFNEALPLSRAVDDKRGEAITLNNLFYILVSLNPRFAVFYGKQSINNYQVLRSNVQGLDKNVQQTFLKSIERIYRRLTDALIAHGRYAEAQQVLNSFKDQQFFDFSQSKQFAPLAVTVREAELTKAFNQKLENLAAAIRTLDEYKRGINESSPTAAEAAQLKSLADKQTAANADYQAFLKSAEKEFAAPPTDKDKFPDVPDLAQLQTTLRELSAQTGEKSVAVYTLVGVDNYRALVVTSDSISSVSTPIKGAVLNQKAQDLWTVLQSPQYDPQPLAKEIYDAVFAPLALKLPADTKTILWSLDGSLRYVPMAALHDGKQYLVERYNNVVFTRADKERLTRSVSTNLTGTGFGSSLLHKVRYGDKVFNARELPAVKTELARIFKSGSSTTGILSGEVLLDAQFTRAAMIATLQKHRPLVHIASHFKFEPGDEANSFLLLGDGTTFTLDEMKQRKDLFAGVELLALSACDTAAQQADATGREVDGFAELAQRLGAGAVMASLWEVSDNSTAELMARFYKTYNGQTGANKASALRSAQMALLSGEYKTAGAANRQLTREEAERGEKIKIDSAKLKAFKIDKASPFAHPYYWSPFILIGNWK